VVVVVTVIVDEAVTGRLGQLFGPEPVAGPALDEALSTLTRDAFGFDACAADVRLEPVPYAFGSPATGALLRLVGTTPRPWSLFCKVLQHVRHWPRLEELPPETRAEFVGFFPWRQELELWEAPLATALPPGLRAPRLHAVVDLGDDRFAVWQEDVPESPEPWTLDRYATAARALGRWNHRLTGPEALASMTWDPCWALRTYAEKAVQFRGIMPLMSDAWEHPWFAAHQDLRGRLLVLGSRLPELLDLAETLQLCRPHGDASPQNLLVPADDPATLVAIDISFQSALPLGADLSQLVVGLVHADRVAARDLPLVAETVLSSYLGGLVAEGWTGDPRDVERGFWISALVRSGFDGFRYELLGDGAPNARRLFEERVRLAAFIAEGAERVL
jgi:hypothetical protein